ncbi:MAG: transposase [Lentisphaeria bacterium]|jgi:hypothetical protein
MLVPKLILAPVFRGRGGGSYPQAAARLRRACPAFFKKWHWWATHSRLAPMRRAAHTLKNHWRGIANAITAKITNLFHCGGLDRYPSTP